MLIKGNTVTHDLTARNGGSADPLSKTNVGLLSRELIAVLKKEDYSTRH